MYTGIDFNGLRNTIASQALLYIILVLVLFTNHLTFDSTFVTNATMYLAAICAIYLFATISLALWKIRKVFPEQSKAKAKKVFEIKPTVFLSGMLGVLLGIAMSALSQSGDLGTTIGHMVTDLFICLVLFVLVLSARSRYREMKEVASISA